jgi:hypothetical protein
MIRTLARVLVLLPCVFACSGPAPTGGRPSGGSGSGGGPMPGGSGSVIIGTRRINVPPQTRGVVITSTCSNLSKGGPVNIRGALPHMHFSGAAFTTEHFRNGASLGFVSNVPRFNPSDYSEDPVSGHQFLPGDTLVTKCTYDNSGSTALGWPDEMCYNFLTVEPASAAQECVEL